MVWKPITEGLFYNIVCGVSPSPQLMTRINKRYIRSQLIASSRDRTGTVGWISVLRLWKKSRRALEVSACGMRTWTSQSSGIPRRSSPKRSSFAPELHSLDRRRAARRGCCRIGKRAHLPQTTVAVEICRRSSSVRVHRGMTITAS